MVNMGISMLSLISLETIDKIFEARSSSKLKSKHKSLYINCLFKHFRGLEATEVNALAFSFNKKDIPNFEKYESQFIVLHEVKVVYITEKEVDFLNVWGEHIDRTLLKAQTENGFNNPIYETMERELKQNQSLIGLIGMKQRLNPQQVHDYIEIFVKEQEAMNTKYRDISECTKHFIYWIPSNVKKEDVKISVVKSNSKLIGM